MPLGLRGATLRETMDKQEIKHKARRILDPVVDRLASMGVSPTLVSVFALFFSLFGAYEVARGSLFAGGVWLLIAGVCDMLDGQLARKRGTETHFGAFIDSTFDRITEFAYFGGLIIYFTTRPEGFSVFVVFVTLVALTASVLISYARARLEGLGYDGTVGLLERPERIALLIAGLLLGRYLLVLALMLLALGSVFTVYQRIRHAYEVTQGGADAPEGTRDEVDGHVTSTEE